MSAVFLNPQLHVQKNDKFTTGIIYMPIILAYLISHFKKNNISTKLLDLYGLNPKKLKKEDNSLIFGIDISEIDQQILKKADCFFIYANQVANHSSVIYIINFLKKNFHSVPIIVLENSQAVTAYSLKKVKNHFFEIGCDYIIIGDLEYPSLELYKNLNNPIEIKNIRGVISKEFSKYLQGLHKSCAFTFTLPIKNSFPTNSFSFIPSVIIFLLKSFGRIEVLVTLL